MARKRQARKCSGRKTNGDPCPNWAMQGQEVCHAHGGRSPQAKAAAQERLAVEAAVARFALDLDDTPAGDIMLREIQRSSAMVCCLAGLVNGLKEEDLRWGVAGRDIRPSAQPGGTPAVQVQFRAQIHPFVRMLADERKQLRDWLMAAHGAGIEQRLVHLAEQDGAWAAKLVGAMFARFVEAWQPTAQQQAEGRAIVAELFRALDRGELLRI
jgi:hypothetical protein